MSTRNTVIVSLIIIVVAIALSAAVYPRLPAAMASHWGADDQVNGTISRFWGACLVPLMSVGMLGLFLLIPMIDPMRANIASFRRIFNVFIVLLMAFMLYIHVLTLLWNLGVQTFRMSTALLPALGLIFILAGVMMRQSKRNFFIGIRTPWTLSSDRVWEGTHRLGAVLFIASGGVALLAAFFPGSAAFWLVIGPVMASTLIVVVYSYMLWREEQ
jgi:uncharacterized membrane protein